jgi:hypothetical protein
MNRFRVGLLGGTGNTIRILASSVSLANGMSPDEALVLAAYLVAIAEPIANLKFADVLKEVQNL